MLNWTRLEELLAESFQNVVNANFNPLYSTAVYTKPSYLCLTSASLTLELKLNLDLQE